MNILLVNPPRFRGNSVIREERCERVEGHSVLEPYSLLQIASILRNGGNEVYLIDANGEDIPYGEVESRMNGIDYDVLIFRFTPTTFDSDMHTTKISKEIRPTAKTVGICFTLRDLAREVMNDAKDLDIYVRHEYEVVVPLLIENINSLGRIEGIAYRDNGEIIINDNAKPIEDYDSLPIPAYDLLSSINLYHIDVPHGKPFTILYSSKGCPFNCIYCTVSGTKLKKKSAGKIIDEIRHLKENYGIKTISFFDETFTIDRRRVSDICNEMKYLDITWYCNSRSDLVDPELLMEMRKAGCRGISFGIESGSQRILDNALKGVSVEQNANAIKWTKDAGIKVNCSFIVGLPGENKKTIKETTDFIKKRLPTGAEFNIAIPYPGTELYSIYERRGFIKNPEWRDMYQDTAFYGTDELSPEELDSARRKLYMNLFLNPRWILQNVHYVLRNPQDFMLATRYFFKYVVEGFFRNWKV
ncbi:MAG: radical SAM protein [Candidatus Altiarchaeales archaeon]|nr:radical SAM protein [Candidatus Altiarchaeales archaeon]